MASKFSVQFSGHSKSSGYSVLDSIEQADSSHFLIYGNVGIPLFALLAPRNPFVPRCIVGPRYRITHILALGCQSKIIQSIVRRFSISMVQVARWPYSVCHAPNNPMGRIIPIVDIYEQVPMPVGASRRFSFKSRIPSFIQTLCALPQGSGSPNKLTRIWPIFKSLMKLFCGVCHIYTHRSAT